MAKEEIELWFWEGGSVDQLLQLESGCHIVLGREGEGRRGKEREGEGSR